jgi:hypothetical protein
MRQLHDFMTRSSDGEHGLRELGMFQHLTYYMVRMRGEEHGREEVRAVEMREGFSVDQRRRKVSVDQKAEEEEGECGPEGRRGGR